MRYDKNDRTLLFTAERELSDEKKAEFFTFSEKLLKEGFKEKIHSPVPEEKETEEKDAGNGKGGRRRGIAPAVFSVICVLTVLAVIVTVILAIIRKDLVLFGYVMCTVVCLMGIGTAVSENDDISYEANIRFGSRLTGSICFLVGAYILILIIIRSTIGQRLLFSLIATGGFFFIGIWLLITGIANTFADKFIYRERIEAACSGFVHHVRFRKGGRIFSSPVFSCEYKGRTYESLFDCFIPVTDETYESGKKTEIRIIPGDPSSVWNNSRGYGVYLIIFSLPFLGVFAMMLYFIATGAI